MNNSIPVTFSTSPVHSTIMPSQAALHPRGQPVRRSFRLMLKVGLASEARSTAGTSAKAEGRRRGQLVRRSFCTRWLAVLSASEVGRTKRLLSTRRPCPPQQNPLPLPSKPPPPPPSHP